MSAEKGFFRKIDDLVTARPAKALAEKGIRANWVTIASIATGIIGQLIILKKIRMPFLKNPECAGLPLVGLSFYLDILDGAVAAAQDGGPTVNGGRFDHAGDRVVDSFLATAEMTGKNVDPLRRNAAEINLALVTRPSELRAIAKSHGVWVPEVDPGSRFFRLFSFMGALMSEEFRAWYLNVNSVQSVISVAIRYGLIRKSGNQQAIQAANNALLSGMLTYGLIRLDQPTGWWGNLASQAVAITPSIFARINSDKKD